MLDLIVGLIILGIAVSVLGLLFRGVIKVLSVALMLCGWIIVAGLFIIAGPPFIVGFLVEKFAARFKIQRYIAIAAIAVSAIYSIEWGIEGEHFAYDAYTFDSMKFIFSVLMALCVFIEPKQTKKILNYGMTESGMASVRQQYYLLFYTSITYMFTSSCAPVISEQYDIPELWVNMLGWCYWGVGIIIQLCATALLYDFKEKVIAISGTLNERLSINGTLWLKELMHDATFSGQQVKDIFLLLVSQKISSGDILEQELAGDNWLFNADWYQTNMLEFDHQLAPQVSYRDNEIREIFNNRLQLPDAANDDFLERYLVNGDYYYFEDDKKFVSFQNIEKICTCGSCGLTKIKEKNHSDSHEWYCSDLCRETEKLCQTIHEHSHEDFLSTAAANGLVLMTLPSVWSNNQKMFSIGGQGHGFAAERANHLVDKLRLKDATLVGDNNAKNGADRIVNGQSFQTKYCATAARSVGAAFDGQNGNYRYFDNSGTPMVLEVPKDQYTHALETMKNKIRHGKVPGVTDPANATKLIKQGSLTYAQAQNITKFATIESVTYDIAEGSIISLTAGGISFAITASIFYFRTGDRQTALQTAAIQAGKTFTRSLAVYVSAQQLHRIAIVQDLLGHIDFSSCSPTVRNALQKGVGASNINALNKMMRGTLVTSLALVAVSSGPDMIKMITGHISGTQFVKNIAVTTASVSGGVVGGIIGGSVFSPLGPLGIWAGQLAGGILGGMVANSLSKKMADKIAEDDRIQIIHLVSRQMAYLASVFLLTESEVENLNLNLSNVLTQKSMEFIFSNKGISRRAAANMIIKPIIVSIIKQRPILTYDNVQIVEAIEKMNTEPLQLAQAS
jgi:hypothetical protein